MSEPKYPLSAPANLEDNLDELFERLSITVRTGNKCANFDAEIQTVDFVAGEETTIHHLLGRTPNGFLTLTKTEYCDIKTISRTDEELVLVADANSIVKIWIL